MKIIVALLLCLAGAPSLAQGIFLESRHAVSQRFGVFEDDGRVAYLYLTKPGSQKPERDALAYARVQPVDNIDKEAAKKAGGAPMLTKALASATGVIEEPVESEFSLTWSRDGGAVALMRNGTPIAFAAASEKYGYSKAVNKTSPLVNVWDQAKYDALFTR